MNQSSTAELQLHYSILENNEDLSPALNEIYRDHLLGCLNKWYGSIMIHEVSLEHEAVFTALKFYLEHPRTFNPAHGSLKGFLEIAADKFMQTLLEREQYTVPDITSHHFLSRYFDNELDIELAGLVVNKVDTLHDYICLLNLGSYRMEQQFIEVRRQKERIRKVLSGVSFPVVATKRKTVRKSRIRTPQLAHQ